jgi:hypothetical protein
MATIDTIQVEIQSSSINAAKGIQELSTALAGLKANGKITTAVNNLNNLRKALHSFGNIPSNASKVLSLASSLEKLKSVGSVATVGNSLAKLATSLKTLNTVSVDKGKIDSIAGSLSSLSNVKAGGINTMMNGLLKIDKVTKELDDAKINAFADRIEKLTDKLTPLSTKMTTIQAGLKGINSSARSAGSGIKDMGNEVDGARVNFASFIYIVQEVVQWLQAAVQKFQEFMQTAIEWDGIHHQFGNAFGAQADTYYDRIVKITNALKINKQTFMELSAMSSSMLIGFGVEETDAREMGLGYAELAYDIWAAYNNVYKTLDGADGAMAAVRSAISGEVEPIRRAGFTIVDSQLAITAANHKLAYSSATATEAQKSYLRYLTLVDQAQQKGIIGTYASEMNKAEGMVRTFSQQLKSLTQAFGSLFIPILVKVMPYLQAFIELLTDAIHRVAQFFGVEIQKVDFSAYKAGAGAIEGIGNSAVGATDALDSAAKAAKELKNATLGIDELNVISPSSASGGAGGAGAGGSGESGYDVPISSIWDEAAFDNFKDEIADVKKKLEGWMPVIGAIAAGFAALRLAKLIADIGDVTKKLKLMFGLTAATGAAAPAAGGFLASIKEFFAAAKQNAPDVGWLAALFPKLSTFLAGLPGMLSSAASALSAAAPYIAIAAAVVGAIVLAFVDYDFSEIGYTIGKKVGEAIRSFGGWAADVGKAIWEGIKTAFNWVKNALDIDDIWDVLAVLFIPGEWLRRITPELTELFKKLSDWINGKIENLKGNINEFFGGFFDGFFDGLGVDVSWAKNFAKIFDIKYLDIVESVMRPSSIGKKIFEKMLGAMDANGIKNKLSTAWNNAKNWWNSKKPGLSTYTPSIGSIYTKVKNAWNSARDWWNKKKGSMSYTPSIGSITSKLKAAWNSAKSWWNKNVKLSTKLNISVPKLTVKWGEVSALGKTFKYPKGFDLKFAAGGGIFDQGSLVWAGERGPEVLANAAGGKTGVMNVQQMQEAVYEGVFAALTAANSGGGNGENRVTNFVLPDGRVLASYVEKAQRERGASIMGNQVYSYG